MSVAVCNANEIRESTVEQAKDEAAFLFRTIGVAIRWTDCSWERMRPDFFVRLRRTGHIDTAGPASLDLMGRAFMDPDGAGHMVDVYFGAIREFALLHSSADVHQVLGYTIAHELGHLLLGSGHRSTGIMQASWRKKELDEIKRRHLSFSDAERGAILEKLRSRCAPGAADVIREERENSRGCSADPSVEGAG